MVLEGVDLKRLGQAIQSYKEFDIPAIRKKREAEAQKKKRVTDLEQDDEEANVAAKAKAAARKNPHLLPCNIGDRLNIMSLLLHAKST